MSRRILTLLLLAAIAAGVCIQAASLAAEYRYVYTENGKGLNIRYEPRIADNILTTAAFGTRVQVYQNLGNGWTAIYWGGTDIFYVQSRFLVKDKPTKKPSSGSGSTSGSAGDNASSVAELNQIFRTYQRVPSPYLVTVRPTRASGWVNLRFAPTKQAELLGTYRENDRLLVIAQLKDWLQVEDPATGAVGFISSKFVVQ